MSPLRQFVNRFPSGPVSRLLLALCLALSATLGGTVLASAGSTVTTTSGSSTVALSAVECASLIAQDQAYVAAHPDAPADLVKAAAEATPDSCRMVTTWSHQTASAGPLAALGTNALAWDYMYYFTQTTYIDWAVWLGTDHVNYDAYTYGGLVYGKWLNCYTDVNLGWNSSITWCGFSVNPGATYVEAGDNYYYWSYALPGQNLYHYLRARVYANDAWYVYGG